MIAIKLLVIIVIWQLSAYAQDDGADLCLCPPSKLIEEKDQIRYAREESSAIFVGEVLSITESGRIVVIRIKVEEAWRHIATTEAVITTPRPVHSCARTEC